jgi:hypothetical protein
MNPRIVILAALCVGLAGCASTPWRWYASWPQDFTAERVEISTGTNGASTMVITGLKVSRTPTKVRMTREFTRSVGQGRE